MRLQIGKRRVSTRFILILVTIVMLISIVIYNLATKNEYVLKTEVVDVNLNGYGFFVWNEQVYPINNECVANYSKMDGASVVKDELVAEVYQRISAMDIKHQNNEIEMDIYDFQSSNLKDDKELNNITFNINNSLYELQKKILDNPQPIQVSEMLATLYPQYEERNQYMDIHAEPTKSLLELYDKEADCEIKLSDQTDRIIAPREGKIFFSVDGYEEKFEFSDIDNINASDGDIAIKPNLEEKEQLNDELLPSFFKIVDEKSCYFIANIESDIVPITGTQVEVDLTSTLVESIQAQIYEVKKTEIENLWTIKLEINNPPDELFNTRISEMYLLYKEMGIFIPNKCITDELKPSISILLSDGTYDEVTINPFLKTVDGYYVNLDENKEIKANNKAKTY